MKTYFLTFPMVLLFALASVNEPSKDKTRLDKSIAMCHETTQSFAQLASDPEFKAIHEDPYAYSQAKAKGKMITYEVAGGEKANAYVVKSRKKSNDYLFVIHEWYGLNDYVKTESDMFSGKFADMNIVALDLYDGKVAGNREDAGKYMQGVKTERALAIINGAKAFVGADANIYTVGWCFGGGWSLQTAIEMGDQAKGAVMFYGMPEKDMERLSTLKCDVLGIFASQDKWINPEVANTFKEKMATVPNELTLKSYDADHGFANPSNPVYDKEAAESAYQDMKTFIAARR